MSDRFNQTYATSPDAETVLRRIDEDSRKHGVQVRGALICADDPEVDILALLRSKVAFTDVLWSTQAGQCLFIKDEHSQGGEPSAIAGRVLILATGVDGILLLLTIDGTQFVTKVIFPAVERCAPRISFPHVTSKAHVGLLFALSKGDNVRHFEVTDVVARSRLYSSKRGKRVRSERTWTGESVEDVLSNLRERNQWLHNVGFNFEMSRDRKPITVSGQISRRCTFRSKGNLLWFYQHAIMPLKDEAAQTLKFYSNRAREDTPKHAPRPIAIEYTEPLFREKSQNQRLIQILRVLPRASISVVHANPYLRASIVDFMDGSSYDVWVLSENRIIVNPQFRASYASAERICDHILSRFGEGSAKDLSETIHA